MVDYYAILRVLPSAEADVVKAAYRALARQYHPDSCTGSTEKAHRRMQEINAAYDVLGDSQKRAAYDRDRGQAKSETEFDSNDDETDLLQQEWKVACKYYPDAEICFDYLSRFSTKLAFSYASYLMDKKEFHDPCYIARKFQNDFTKNYFGNNIYIQQFAIKLLLCGEKDAAKTIARVVKILGKSILFEKLRLQVFEEYPKSRIKLIFLNAINRYDDLNFTIRFLELMGLNCVMNFWGNALKVTYNGTDVKVHRFDCPSWVKKNFGHEEDFRVVWQRAIPLNDYMLFRGD